VEIYHNDIELEKSFGLYPLYFYIKQQYGNNIIGPTTKLTGGFGAQRKNRPVQRLVSQGTSPKTAEYQEVTLSNDYSSLSWLCAFWD